MHTSIDPRAEQHSTQWSFYRFSLVSKTQHSEDDGITERRFPTGSRARRRDICSLASLQPLAGVCHKYRKYHFIKIIYILIHFNERVDKSSIKALDLPRNLLPFPRTVRLKVVERKPQIENIVSVQCLIWGYMV